MSKDHNILKSKAIELRLQGLSYRAISDKLDIARSTLSGWLKSVPLSLEQKEQLHKQWVKGLNFARIKGTQSRVNIKLEKIRQSHLVAQDFIKSISLDNNSLELFLAGLYLGDGFKKTCRLGLGNSNPKIVLLFITLLRQLYPINEKKIRGAIFGRADQNQDQLILYWSKILHIPKNQFHKTQLDQRTINKPSDKRYFGVCAVSYNDCSLQRRILAIGQEMLKYRNKANRGG